MVFSNILNTHVDHTRFLVGWGGWCTEIAICAVREPGFQTDEGVWPLTTGPWHQRSPLISTPQERCAC
eukprot:9404244-Pyramimonas_sp.AAC.1